MNSPTHLIGPSLASLTPDQLDELIALAGIDRSRLMTLSEWRATKGKRSRSQHNEYVAIHHEKTTRTREHIEIQEWRVGGGEEPEGDYMPIEIYVGEITGHYGFSLAVLPVVHWFLKNGWKWSEEL